MNLDRRLRRSAEEAENLFKSKPVPSLPERRPWGPVVVVATALVVLAVFGLVAVFTEPDDSGPAVTGTPSTSTTIPPTTTIGESSGVEPLRLDDGVSLVPVEMEDGTRIAVLLPTELVPGRVEVDAGSSSAELEGPGFHGALSYAFCPGDTQDAGSLNIHGALVAQLSDRLVVCRPDQVMTLDIFTNGDAPTRSPEAFNLVPMDLGTEYLAVIEASNQSPFCCDAFGPLRTGPLVITANRFTSGEITAWDYETLVPQWTTSIGNSSILLGSLGDLVVATPGRGGLVGVDADNGEIRWELGFPQDEEVVGVGNETGGSIWYISTEFPNEGAVAAPHLRAVDVEFGELMWMTEGRPGTLLQWVDPAVFPDLVVVMDVPRFVAGQDTSTTSHLIAFDRTTGEQVWTTDLDDPTEAFSDRLLGNDPDTSVLIAATPDGEVFSIDPETGQILWRTETGFVRIIELDTSTVRLQQGESETQLDLQTGDQINR